MLDFGQTIVNTTATKSLALVNESDFPVDGIAALLSGPDAALFSIVDAPASVPAKARVAVNVEYAPKQLEAHSTATVTFSGTGGVSAQVPLDGEPVGVALTLEPNPINFGYASFSGTSIGCTVVTNQSPFDIHIVSVADFATCGGAFALASTDDAEPPNPTSFPIALNGGTSAKVCFTLTPQLGEQYQGQATLVVDDPRMSNPVVQLSGWGGGPGISCTPMTLDFGQTLAHQVSTIPIICTNTGTYIPGANLMIDSVTTNSGVFTVEFDQTNDPYPLDGLAPGQSAQIDVSYAPTEASNDVGMLLVHSNAGGGSTLEIPLRGQGLNVPPCQYVVAPSAFDLTDTKIGQTAQVSLEVQNVGSNICLIQGPSITDDPTNAFSILSMSIQPDPVTGKVTIPPPGTGATSHLQFTVAFSPTVVGPASADLSVAGEDTQITGTGISP